jgi:hypothetical protein
MELPFGLVLICNCASTRSANIDMFVRYRELRFLVCAILNSFCLAIAS